MSENIKELAISKLKKLNNVRDELKNKYSDVFEFEEYSHDVYRNYNKLLTIQFK